MGAQEKIKVKWELADKPGSVVAQKEPGQSFIWVIRRRRPQATYPGTARTTHYVPLFGLAPSGVYPAMPVTRHAVRSYRTISPLPASRRYIFCGTSRGFTPPRRYLALCPAEPGLSSLHSHQRCKHSATAWPTPDANITGYAHPRHHQNA